MARIEAFIVSVVDHPWRDDNLSTARDVGSGTDSVKRAASVGEEDAFAQTAGVGSAVHLALEGLDAIDVAEPCRVDGDSGVLQAPWSWITGFVMPR
ncbi:hypothetical protein GCM10009677_23880 [Sphaerisporangium rubeum]